MNFRMDAGLITGSGLVPYIDAGGWIAADDDHRQSGLHALLG